MITTPHTWDSLPVSVELHHAEHSRRGVPFDVETFIIRFHPLNGGAILFPGGDFLSTGVRTQRGRAPL